MEIPIRSLVVLIKGTPKDAEDFAKSWLASNESNAGYWYIAIWFDGNLLVEIHDEGNGSAYLPSIIDDFHRKAETIKEDQVVVNSIIPGSEAILSIELTSMGLRKLSLPSDRFTGDILAGEPKAGQMTRFSPRPDVPLLLLSVFLMTLASFSLFLSVEKRPTPHPITISPVVQVSPWQAWKSGIEDHTAGHPDTVFYKRGSWSWRLTQSTEIH